MCFPLSKDSHPLEVWDAEEDLDHCAEVAAVAQVFDACVTRTKHRLQLHARLLDHLPFADPRPGVIVCVVPILCLKTEGERMRAWCQTFTEEDSHFFFFFFVQLRQLTLFCICSMSIPKCDKWSDM